jgi:predicted deacetylase
MLDEADATPDEANEVLAELQWWLSILRQANEQHAALPALVRADIDAGHSPRELARLATHVADLSTGTRHQVERVLVTLIAELEGRPVIRRAACQHLRVVGLPAG